MDNLDLLKLDRNNKITIDRSHSGLWSEDSPIGKKIKTDWLANFAKRSTTLKTDNYNLHSVRYLWLSDSSIREFISRSRELHNEFSRRSRVEDAIFEDTQPMCCLSLVKSGHLTEASTAL